MGYVRRKRKNCFPRAKAGRTETVASTQPQDTGMFCKKTKRQTEPHRLRCEVSQSWHHGRVGLGNLGKECFLEALKREPCNRRKTRRKSGARAVISGTHHKTKTLSRSKIVEYFSLVESKVLAFVQAPHAKPKAQAQTVAQRLLCRTDYWRDRPSDGRRKCRR